MTQEFDWVVFIACMVGGAVIVGYAYVIYLVLGDIYDRFFGETEDLYP